MQNHNLRAALLSLVLFSIAAPSHPQSAATSGQSSWSDAQQEVWKTVVAYSAASQDRDLDRYLGYWHPGFLGWHNGDDGPTNKAERTKGLRWYFANSTPEASSLEPLGILVHGDTAVVHYRSRQTLVSKDGSKSNGLSNWTDVLVQEDGRWLLIGDHGGAVSSDASPDDPGASSDTDAETAPPLGMRDPLLQHIAGSWILRGRIDGQEVAHDIDAEWILNGNYLQLHEVSRAKDADGRAAYEAIVLLGWDATTGRYACQWLDITGGGGLTSDGIGYAVKEGDKLPFLFKFGTETLFHTTFSYDRKNDAWRWLMESERNGTFSLFADTTLSRKP